MHNEKNDFERAQREECRWRILRAIHMSSPVALAETVIWRAVAGSELPFTPRDIRRELHFLEKSKLLTISGQQRDYWTCELTADGINVVEYTVDAPAGITRPPQ
jgi:hypothetical protein